MIRPIGFTMGTDPEIFLKRGDRIIGSERVIPKEGLSWGAYAKIVRDGIQAELHPAPCGAAELLCNGLTTCFRALQYHLSVNHPDVKVCWAGVVEVEKSEVDALSPESRILGCAPSRNFYGLVPMTVDPAKYLIRAAGGHQHIGIKGIAGLFLGDADERTSLIPLLDIFVGNTGVLLDRNPAQTERRLMYGQVGQFRLPIHGLEYRTLSNFWLRHSSLVDLMFGMARLAVSVLFETLNGPQNLEQELIDVVDIKKIMAAIQNNDYVQARENFETIVPFLLKHLPDYGFPLNKGSMDRFRKLTEMIDKKGLDEVFPEDPMDHWTKGSHPSFQQLLAKMK